VSKNAKGSDQDAFMLGAISLRGGSSLGLLGSLSRSSTRLSSRLVFLGSFTSRTSFAITPIGRSPQGQVVSKQLHNEGAVAVGLLRERVEFGDGVVERLLSKVARTVRRVEDFVVEDAEVEGEAEADRVGWSKLSLRDIRGVLGSLISRRNRWRHTL
jgi:hypothetical protein